MVDIVNRLTENGNYANEICLLIMMSDNEYMLKYLDECEIRGKKLETFANTCCNECDLSLMAEVLLCISWDVFDLNLVHKNLDSAKPIAFIDELHKPNESLIQRYKRYKQTFINNMNNNPKR